MPLGILKPSFGLGEGGGRNGYIREDGVRPPNPRREDGMWVTPTPSINPRREDGLWNRALPVTSPIYGAGGVRTTQPYNRMQDSMANAMNQGSGGVRYTQPYRRDDRPMYGNGSLNQSMYNGSYLKQPMNGGMSATFPGAYSGVTADQKFGMGGGGQLYSTAALDNANNAFQAMDTGAATGDVTAPAATTTAANTLRLINGGNGGGSASFREWIMANMPRLMAAAQARRGY